MHLDRNEIIFLFASIVIREKEKLKKIASIVIKGEWRIECIENIKKIESIVIKGEWRMYREIKKDWPR